MNNKPELISKVSYRFENGCTTYDILSLSQGNYYPKEHVVSTGDGRYILIDGFYRSEQIARRFAELDALYGPFDIFDKPTKIPIEIATEGNAAIAAYLSIAHYPRRPNKVANKIGVERSTVVKYYSRINREADKLRTD